MQQLHHHYHAALHLPTKLRDDGFALARGVDLSGGNVMLRTAEDCPHGGVAAKVADFGLSRIMDVQSRMQTRMYGTVRHHKLCLCNDGA